MPDNNSFLPEDYLARKIARRTNFICLSLFAVVTVGVVAAWFVTDQQRGQVLRQQEQIDASYAETAKRIAEMEDLQHRKKQMIRKAKVISVLVEPVPRSLIMAEMINQMPPTLSLTEFELDTKVIRVAERPKTAIERQRERMNQKAQLEEQEQPSAPQTEVNLKLVGIAPTDVEVSTFIAKLNQHAMFEQVVLAYSEQTRVLEKPMRRFRVEAVLNQDVDVARLEPTMVSRKIAGDPMGDKIHINNQGDVVAPDQVGAVDTE